MAAFVAHAALCVPRVPGMSASATLIAMLVACGVALVGAVGLFAGRASAATYLLSVALLVSVPMLYMYYGSARLQAVSSDMGARPKVVAAVAELRDASPSSDGVDEIDRLVRQATAIVDAIRADRMSCVPPQTPSGKATSTVVLPGEGAFDGVGGRLRGDAAFRSGSRLLLRNEPLRTLKRQRALLKAAGSRITMALNVPDVSQQARRIDVFRRMQRVLAALDTLDAFLVDLQVELMQACDSQRSRMGGSWEFWYDGVHDRDTLPRYQYGAAKYVVAPSEPLPRSHPAVASGRRYTVLQRNDDGTVADAEMPAASAMGGGMSFTYGAEVSATSLYDSTYGGG